MLEYYEPLVVITVMDKGHGFGQEDVLPGGTIRPDERGGERIGGFGLSPLAGLSDNLKFKATVPHRTTVHVEKKLRYETQGDADEAAERDLGEGIDIMGDTRHQHKGALT